MLQLGITDQPDQRLAVHSRRRWSVVDVRGPLDGVEAQAWERSCLLLLKMLAVPTALSNWDMAPSRQLAIGGRKAGEAWWVEDLAVSSLRELMDAVEKAEEESLL